MTREQILSTRKPASELYAALPHLPMSEAAAEPLHLCDLHGLKCTVNGTQYPYANGLVKACIDSILSKYHRRDAMLDSERWELAERVVQFYAHLSVTELKTFEDMLISNRLLTFGMGGKEEYDLKCFDQSSILAKLRVYDERRPIKHTEAGGRVGEKTIEQLRQEDFKRRHPCPYNCYSDFRRTHDADRNKMPEGWDFEGYWTWWHETHDINRQLISPEEQATRNHQAYWNRTLKDWDTPDLQALIDRVCAKAAHAYPSI
ncbi:MAG: hypothetical protein IKN59_06150 [Paludibacteraceae bacterium]|nr:hypothetical protein [Paludibacteraceae bacterium]